MLTKQALGNTLWGMADTLRGKVEDYKAYILSILFFKRLSDNYTWETENAINDFKKARGREPTETELKIITSNKHDFIIPENCFWKDVKGAKLSMKNKVLADAVKEIADKNIDNNGTAFLKGIIDTVKWNEAAPDGSGGKKLDPAVLTNLINYLDPVDLSNKNVSVDVLGDAYEYLIKKFADENKGGTTAGQFYTPQEVVDIIVRYLKPQEGNTVYDPTCGSGGFLINSAKYAKEQFGSQKSVRLFGQESVWNTWAICNINMVLHGLDSQIKREDTIIHPQFTDEDNELEVRKFDFVMANFPFSQENWTQTGTPKKDKKGKAVLKKDGSPQLEYPKEDYVDPYGRLIYGTPPYSNGDFAFLQHIVASIGDNGKAGVVCPQGVFFRGQPEKTEEEDGQNRKADDEYLIRRGLLQGIPDADGNYPGINIIDAIVVLPNNLFYGTTIPGSILFINKNKSEERKNKVLMVYAAKEGWYREEPNMNVLEMQDVLRISTILESWGDIKIAKQWITLQKKRLNERIQDNLNFEFSEIDLKYSEDLQNAIEKIEKVKEELSKKEQNGKKITLADKKRFDTANAAKQKLIEKKEEEISKANERAQKQSKAIDEVENELIKMFSDSELRKRYFSVVDINDIEENEFNLNIPRYVDTFEPEEEIELKQAIETLKTTCEEEKEVDNNLFSLIGKLS